MAERPVFIPNDLGACLVMEVPVNFRWHPGMSPSQKMKNVVELHGAAYKRGFRSLLEVSSKSVSDLGKSLSAFNQTLKIGARDVSVECAYQGSKVFENGGPYVDLFTASSRDAKRDERLRTSGRLIGFKFQDEDFPLSPPTSFYDWLYVNAVYSIGDIYISLQNFSGFTDIEFNPERSLNCQARSLALFVSLERRDQLDMALESFPRFLEKSYIS